MWPAESTTASQRDYFTDYDQAKIDEYLAEKEKIDMIKDSIRDDLRITDKLKDDLGIDENAVDGLAMPEETEVVLDGE